LFLMLNVFEVCLKSGGPFHRGGMLRSMKKDSRVRGFRLTSSPLTGEDRGGGGFKFYFRVKPSCPAFLGRGTTNHENRYRLGQAANLFSN
jgi:hypothetical protein